MRKRERFIDELVKVYDQQDHSTYHYGRVYEISRKAVSVTRSPYDFDTYEYEENEENGIEIIKDPEDRIDEIPISEFIDWIEKEGINKLHFMEDFQFEHEVFTQQEKCFIPGEGFKKQETKQERLYLSKESSDSLTYSNGLRMWLSPNSDRTEWYAIVENSDDYYYKTQFAVLRTVSDLQRLNTLIPQRYLSDYDDYDDCLEDIMNNYLDQDEDADE